MLGRNAKTLATITLAVGALSLSGCATTHGNQNTLTNGALGAAAGAIAGAIIGNNAGDGDAQAGALIGAIVGGAGGAYSGCREDGGCKTQSRQQSNQYYDEYGRPIHNQTRNQGYSQPQIRTGAQVGALNKRQFFDQRTRRYYFYDSVAKQEFYENGERKRN